MSTDQPINQQAVEETKRQIRSLVGEIASLSRQELDPTIFYGEFLKRVVAALAAEGGAVWTMRKGSGLELSYQMNLRDAFPETTGDDWNRHARLLHQVLKNGEPMLVPPYSGAGDEEEAGNPTSFLLCLSPVIDDKDPSGIVEIFQRPTGAPASQRGYMRFLGEMCEHVADYMRGRKLQELTNWQDLFSRVDRFSRSVHEGLDPLTTSYTIANEGRRLIGCDRVSVALRKGRKCIVEAVSGQDTMDTRANSVVLLSKLATAVMRSAEPLWYTGDSSDLPPQIEAAVHDYVDETHTKTVAVLPLFKPSDYVPDGDEAKRLLEEKEEVIGCLIVEQIEDSRAREEFSQGVELVSEHSARALSNAVEHNNLFLMPLWRTIGKMAWILRARTLPKTLAVVAAVAVAFAAMWLVQWDFDMKAKGSLEPKLRRPVFVDTEGKITDIEVKHGDLVEKGDLLMKLDSATDIPRTLIEKRYQLSIERAQLRSMKRLQNNADVEVSQQINAKQQIPELEYKIRTLISEVAELEKEEKKLEVRSPISGRVINPFRVHQVLEGRSVSRGDQVMLVADLEQVWVLDVYMGEENMGHVANAMKDAETVTVDGKPMKKLDVTYILKSNPEEQLEGTLFADQIHDNAELNDEHGHAVLMEIAIDKSDLHKPRTGTEVTVKVHCGQQSVGYVWFHQLIEFVQSQMWW